MIWRKTDLKGTHHGELVVRTTPFDEIGIAEFKDKKGVSAQYWFIEDTDKIIEEIRKVIEEHKREKLREVK